MARTTTLQTVIGATTAPDKKLIRIPAKKARVQVDILSMAPGAGRVAFDFVEAVNPIHTLEYSREASNMDAWTVGRTIKGDQSWARARIVSDTPASGQDAAKLALVGIQGRFVAGETIRETGVTGDGNTAAYASLLSLPVRSFDEGASAGAIAATATDASVFLDDLPGGELLGDWYFIKTTFSGGVTSASYVLRITQ